MRRFIAQNVSKNLTEHRRGAENAEDAEGPMV